MLHLCYGSGVIPRKHKHLKYDQKFATEYCGRKIGWLVMQKFAFATLRSNCY